MLLNKYEAVAIGIPREVTFIPFPNDPQVRFNLVDLELVTSKPQHTPCVFKGKCKLELIQVLNEDQTARRRLIVEGEYNKDKNLFTVKQWRRVRPFTTK